MSDRSSADRVGRPRPWPRAYWLLPNRQPLAGGIAQGSRGGRAERRRLRRPVAAEGVTLRFADVGPTGARPFQLSKSHLATKEGKSQERPRLGLTCNGPLTQLNGEQHLNRGPSWRLFSAWLRKAAPHDRTSSRRPTSVRCDRYRKGADFSKREIPSLIADRRMERRA
jgi:hypothetical protein